MTNLVPHDIEEWMRTMERRYADLAGRRTGSLAANPPTCRVYSTAVQSIPDNTVTPLTFDSERFDTDFMHSTAISTQRISFNTAGLYSVGGAGRIANAADYTSINLRVRMNNTTDIVHSDVLVSTSATIAQIKNVSTIYKFDVGDYIELLLMQDNTANVARNTVVNPEFAPEFWAVRLGSGD